MSIEDSPELVDLLVRVATNVAHSTAEMLHEVGVDADAVVLLQLPEGVGGVTIGACMSDDTAEQAGRSVRRALESAYEVVMKHPEPDSAVPLTFSTTGSTDDVAAQ